MENYEKIKRIGNGNFGRISLVQRRSDGQVFAMKKIPYNPDSINPSTSPLNEVKMLESLDHPNIIRYYDSFASRNKYCILMEFAEDGAATTGDLQQRVKQARNSKTFITDETKIIEWVAQLCLALKYLFDRKILHRDIKLQNIFLSKEGLVKLGDFGISKKLDFTGDFARTALGTPYYLSPEICSNSTYNHMTDIWMLGCAIYELCALEKPFTGESFPEVMNKILNENPAPIPERVCPFLRDLVKKILNKNPNMRPNILEILEMREIKEKCMQYLHIHVKTLEDCLEYEEEEEEKYEELFSEIEQPVEPKALLKCPEKPPELLINPHLPLQKKNSITSIIQARKISISPTNNSTQGKQLEAKAPIESTFGAIKNVTFDDNPLKRPGQRYQRQISINISALENSHNKKGTPLSTVDLGNNNNIPTEKVRPKTFNFVNTIFNPKSPNSPNRTILFSEYLVQRLGEARFRKMKGYLDTHPNPLRVLDEERAMVAEFIGEENMDCIKIFKYLMSNVVTPSKGETMIRMKDKPGLRGARGFEEIQSKD